MDEINIKQLEVYAYHGVYEREKESGQKFYVDLKIKTNLQKCLIDDNIENTLHYGIVSEQVHKFLSENRYDLIETAAYKTANFLLEKFKDILEVELELFKPNAPIELDFENISVKIKSKRNTVYIALGSNIGDSNEFFNRAINMLSQVEGIFSIKESKRIKSKPYGMVKQEDFLNSVIEVKTSLNCQMLLDVLLKIEGELGRERNVKWGPRTIDLDIIFYNFDIIYSENLIVPHPLMGKRDFVLKPLSELAPYYTHPIYKKSILSLLEELTDIYIKE